jgi:hypothetical protein
LSQSSHRRLGHEWATNVVRRDYQPYSTVGGGCPSASSLELLLTMSSDRQLVLTRHDLHQLLARPTSAQTTSLAACPFATCARIGEDTPALPESRWKVSTGADDRVSSFALARAVAA